MVLSLVFVNSENKASHLRVFQVFSNVFLEVTWKFARILEHNFYVSNKIYISRTVFKFDAVTFCIIIFFIFCELVIYIFLR